MKKLKRVEDSTLAKSVFATLAVSALFGAILVFPSVGYIIKYFADDKKKQDYVKRIIRRLEKQDLINISEKPDGQITIIITDSGKEKALTYQLETMKIKKPARWDNIWRVVIFDIPEGQKKARNLLRHHLKKLDFFPLQKSVFVHPFHCKKQIDFLKHNFGVANYITYMEVKSMDQQNLLRNYFQV
ncbi:MAG: hypothetical protein WD988_01040 [Candidatus Curtissbacteria bacterium]